MLIKVFPSQIYVQFITFMPNKLDLPNLAKVCVLQQRKATLTLALTVKPFASKTLFNVCSAHNFCP